MGLYRYHVETQTVDLLKDYTLTGDAIIVPPSLNQAGDRLLVVTVPGRVFRSYQLPAMTNERTFTVPTLPPDCDMRDVRYIGYQNYIAVSCRQSSQGNFTEIYDDTGVLLSHFAQDLGHSDFSPNGQWAYSVLASIDRVGNVITKKPLEVHVVNIDGTNDHILYSVPFDAAVSINLHIAWPDHVNEWFVVSFYPPATVPPLQYAPPFDEILLLSTDGTQHWLARTGTTNSDYFWSQPLASPSSDGTRISFNSTCSNASVGCTPSGTIDQYILFTQLSAPPGGGGGGQPRDF